MAAAPSATLKEIPLPPSARRFNRPAMVAVAALAKVVTAVFLHSSWDPVVVLVPWLLWRVPPVIWTPPVRSQICIVPALVTVPPLITI